ncbi:UNVERIFIED_CONTAM: hypothetical protein K2H54_006838 [Gekko kuhli]
MKLQVELARIEAEKEIQMARFQAEREEKQRELERFKEEKEIERLRLEDRERERGAEREHEERMYNLKLHEVQLKAEFQTENRHEHYPSVEQKRFPRETAPLERPASILQVWRVQEAWSEDYIETVTVNEQKIKAYRNTGAQVSLIQPEFVQEHQYLPGKFYTIQGIKGPTFKVHLAEVPVQSREFQGNWIIGVLSGIRVPLLVGNNLASQVTKEPNLSVKVVTRGRPAQPCDYAGQQQEKRKTVLQNIQAAEALTTQQQDDSLSDLRQTAELKKPRINVEQPCQHKGEDQGQRHVALKATSPKAWEQQLNHQHLQEVRMVAAMETVAAEAASQRPSQARKARSPLGERFLSPPKQPSKDDISNADRVRWTTPLSCVPSLCAASWHSVVPFVSLYLHQPKVLWGFFLGACSVLFATVAYLWHGRADGTQDIQCDAWVQDLETMDPKTVTLTCGVLYTMYCVLWICVNFWPLHHDHPHKGNPQDLLSIRQMHEHSSWHVAKKIKTGNRNRDCRRIVKDCINKNVKYIAENYKCQMVMNLS